MDVAAEETAVRENVRVADDGVVTEVTPDHEEIAIPHDRVLPFARAAMDRDVFAKGVFGSHDHPADEAAVETEILRIGPDDRAVSDLATLAEDHRTDDLGMTSDHTTRADAGS
jgi:hypothetical protein